jgi:hypothetical protein
MYLLVKRYFDSVFQIKHRLGLPEVSESRKKFSEIGFVYEKG